jgi:23S rRNA pseudouridine1911/1915/1917 synthase
MAKFIVPHNSFGTRLDQWLTTSVPGLSRARWQSLIRQGRVRVDGLLRRPAFDLRGGETVEYEIPEAEPLELRPEDVPLDILMEDTHLIAINKPPGMVVHPAPGHAEGTLVHALLHHCKDLAGIGGVLRPGIVHRLDKDTSGVLVAAKNEAALLALQGMFKRREIRKEYLALVRGVPSPPSGTIDTLIGRSPQYRKKMDVLPDRGKRAISHYEVVRSFGGAALVRVRIETGRTHQIRVHLSHIGHAVVGDPLYGGRRHGLVLRADRQMLHAAQLGCLHPVTRRPLLLDAPMPADMRALMDALDQQSPADRCKGT